MSDHSPILSADRQLIVETAELTGEDVEIAARAIDAMYVDGVQRHTVRVLIAAQLLGALGLAAGGTAGSLLATEITGSEAAAGLPLAVLVFGSGLSAVAVTRIMEHTGRRVGLAIAHLGGALGAGVVVVAAVLRSWPLLLVGCGLLGSGTAAVTLARYAAADLSGRSGRSISAVVGAASVGAIAGPNLLGTAGSFARAGGLPEPAGLFLLAAPAFASAALVLLVFLRPDPLSLARVVSAGPAQTGGGVRILLADSDIRFALLVLGITNLAMVGVMAVTPVHLHVHRMALDMVGLLISAHIGAMFLPSPVTGWLSDRFGGHAVAALGAMLLLAAGALAAAAGSDSTGVIAALLLLGAGWNAGLIGGSTLLRRAQVDPALRTRAEGFGELGMGAAAGFGGTGAGPLLAAGGFALVGLVAAAPCLLLLLAVVAAGRRRGRIDRSASTVMPVLAVYPTARTDRRRHPFCPTGGSHDHDAHHRPGRGPRRGMVRRRTWCRRAGPDHTARRSPHRTRAVVRALPSDGRRRVPGARCGFTQDQRLHIRRVLPRHDGCRRGVGPCARARRQGSPATSRLVHRRA